MGIPAKTTINLTIFAQTDIGRTRGGNEDNFLVFDLSSGKYWVAHEEGPQDVLTYVQEYYGSLLAVADGEGGEVVGKAASRLAVETVRDRLLQLQEDKAYETLPLYERLRLAIEEANSSIYIYGQADPDQWGFGVSFTAVAIQSSYAYAAQVGDSRAYLIRCGNIYQLTKDQSLVQQMVDAGQITEEEAQTHSYRVVIMQALGGHTTVNVEVSSIPLCQLDTLVLCSDGLSNKMRADEIMRIINSASDFKSACQSLISLANERGGEDNISVVIAQISGAALPLPDSDMLGQKKLQQ